ncbi:hypothetical protein ACKUV4_018265 [Acinetobacter baumannii]
MDDQRTPNEEEEEQLLQLIKKLPQFKNIDRVKDMIKQARKEAGENGTPVAGGSQKEAAITAGGGNPAPRVEVESILKKVLVLQNL